MNSTIKFKENDVKELIKLLMLDNAELVKIKEEAELATTKKKIQECTIKRRGPHPDKKDPRRRAKKGRAADRECRHHYERYYRHR